MSAVGAIAQPIYDCRSALTWNPRVTLHRLAKRGVISPIARGLYRRRTEKAFDFDLAEIAAKIPTATICLTSALAEHGLSDAISAKLLKVARKLPGAEIQIQRILEILV